MVGTWAFVIGLCLLGFLLLMLELFVIPGFGVAGILGLAGIFAAIIYATMNLGIWIGIAVFVVSLGVSIWAVSRATTGSTFSRLRNPRVSPGRVVPEASVESVGVPEIGARGTALTTLRPAGVVRFEADRYDVIADGPIIEVGAAVEVVERIGNVTKVRAV